jgi:hypothetical protein
VLSSLLSHSSGTRDGAYLLTVLYSVPDAVIHGLFLPPALHHPPFPFHGFL